MIVPVILAGGSGTRLWPFSREHYPKQLLPLTGSFTMLQDTILRLSSLENLASPIVICNENHRFLVAEQLRQINIRPSSIILEPVGRNTAPAVAIAAFYANSLQPDTKLLVLPADHFIADEDSFHAAVQIGTEFAEERYLVTFGILPHTPETGYGYIEKGIPIASSTNGREALRISRFVEKPDQETAQSYVDSGRYLWNSGMFLFLASQILEELGRYAPDIVNACQKAFDEATTDVNFLRLGEESFRACPSESIDYAVLEKTDNGVMIPLDAGWSDLGSWDTLWGIQDKDEHQNVALGDTLLHDVKSSYMRATSRMVAVIGVENHVIIETPDAVLVAARDRVQDVKLLVQQIKASGRDEVLHHTKVYRPWGCYESLNCDTRSQVKRITVKPGAQLSLQKHHHRAEHWVVVRGTALVTRGEESFLLKEDESTYIPLGANHRLENPGKIPLELIEVQSGSYLGEDDIVRLEDVYGRQH